MTSAVLYVLLVLPCLIHAGPMKKGAEGKSFLSRFTRDSGFIRPERQASDFRCQVEGNNTDCLPDGVNAAPTFLVNCLLGQCVCNDCFMHNSSNGKCRTCSDYGFSENQQVCGGNDNRPKQLTAFLLSLFLSSTGAANFYIGQNSLGGGQIFLLILTFAMSYFMCCLPCCLACCLSKEDVKGSVVFILLMVLAVIVVILAALAMWAWWIADLVIFATNQRFGGNGCELTPNL